MAAARGAGAPQCRDADRPGARIPQDGRPGPGPRRVPSGALARARPRGSPPGRGAAPRPALSRMAVPPSCTVVICTRDRPALLDRCLGAVTRLDHPGFRILVVDNAPTTTETRDVTRHWRV